jgi:hypothetical protein
MPDDPTRAPFSELRAWVPVSDVGTRARSRERLDAHIASSGRERRSLGAWLSARAGRRRMVGPLVAAVAVLGAGVAVASQLLRTEHTAQLPVFAAAGQLSPQFRVGAHGSGYCWTASLATATTDAYRCMAGNAIHDPCFAASRHARTVACFIDPWHAVTMLSLTKPLPRHGPAFGPALPWAIETVDGRRCTFLTGATAAMGGERINYGCIHPRSLLIGGPDRRTSLWTIRSSRTYRPDAPGHPRPLSAFRLLQIKRTIS